MLYNIHTHSLTKEEGVESIYNFRFPDRAVEKIPENQLFSAGVHPWDARSEDIELYRNWLDEAPQYPNCVALGEAGIDAIRGADKESQEAVFRLHAEMAEKHKLPLIIHAVRAHQDIIRIRKTGNFAVPWIVHGFTAKPEVAEMYFRAGIHISIGEFYIQNPEKLARLLTIIPLSSLFVETDESEISIRLIYNAIADSFRLTQLELERSMASIFVSPKKISAPLHRKLPPTS
ncbi:MAG: TatD family hydrolase [Bacteroidetes bacterium]|nr:TatD family hydrolase [Bacteroidota bacterium]MBU1720493.1 TatD family hydrolase [Bacteroidota bacterium]